MLLIAFFNGWVMSQRYSNLNTQLKPDFDSKGKPSHRVGLKGRLLVLPDRAHWIKMGAKLRTQGENAWERYQKVEIFETTEMPRFS